MGGGGSEAAAAAGRVGLTREAPPPLGLLHSRPQPRALPASGALPRGQRAGGGHGGGGGGRGRATATQLPPERSPRRMIMKIIQMMGPSHPKGGEWAQEIVLGVVKLQVKILALVTIQQKI